MDTSNWYKQLIKPDWAPKDWVFGAAWSVLYPIIVAVNVYIFYLLVKGKIGILIAVPFWLNLVFNLIFTPIQFGLKNNWLAFTDITLVLITIVWAMLVVWPYAKIVTIAFVPYLIWVAIATILQFSISINN